MTNLLSYLLLISFSIANTENEYINGIIGKLNQEFNQVVDFQAKMSVKLEVPGIRIPKKSYNVYFKQPNKIKANTKGFGILPNTGIFTSPEDNFDNLKSLRLNPNASETRDGYIMITGISTCRCSYRYQ